MTNFDKHIYSKLIHLADRSEIQINFASHFPKDCICKNSVTKLEGVQQLLYKNLNFPIILTNHELCLWSPVSQDTFHIKAKYSYFGAVWHCLVWFCMVWFLRILRACLPTFIYMFWYGWAFYGMVLENPWDMSNLCSILMFLFGMA